MAIVNISLPDQMKQYIEERLSEVGYSTTSEYLRGLIREDPKRRAEEKLESPSSEWTKYDAVHVKKAVRERLAEKHKNA